MKKIIFGFIATFMLNSNIYAQTSVQQTNDVLNITASNETLENETLENESLVKNENLRFSCTRINVGINIFIAWGSADVYIGCGFPPDYFYPSGCKPVSKRMCELIDAMNKDSNYTLNIKEFFKDVDLSKVTSLEITKSTSFLDDDGFNTSIKLGKYDVDTDGNFRLEIIKVK